MSLFVCLAQNGPTLEYGIIKFRIMELFTSFSFKCQGSHQKSQKKLHTFVSYRKNRDPRPFPVFHNNIGHFLASKSFFLHFFGCLPITRIANFYLISTGNSSPGNILYEEELQDNLERKNRVGHGDNLHFEHYFTFIFYIFFVNQDWDPE